MGYVSDVGRVGALAVALGVGIRSSDYAGGGPSGAIGLWLVVQLFVFGLARSSASSSTGHKGPSVFRQVRRRRRLRHRVQSRRR